MLQILPKLSFFFLAIQNYSIWLWSHGQMHFSNFMHVKNHTVRFYRTVKAACRSWAVRARVVGAGPKHCVCREKCQGTRGEGRPAAPYPPAVAGVGPSMPGSFPSQPRRERTSWHNGRQQDRMSQSTSLIWLWLAGCSRRSLSLKIPPGDWR